MLYPFDYNKEIKVYIKKKAHDFLTKNIIMCNIDVLEKFDYLIYVSKKFVTSSTVK